jgi:hypothetical protein
LQTIADRPDKSNFTNLRIGDSVYEQIPHPKRPHLHDGWK